MIDGNCHYEDPHLEDLLVDGSDDLYIKDSYLDMHKEIIQTFHRNIEPQNLLFLNERKAGNRNDRILVSRDACVSECKVDLLAKDNSFPSSHHPVRVTLKP